MEDFKIVADDLEDHYFRVESAQGDVWPFSIEDGKLSLAVVFWVDDRVPTDAEARTRDATAAAHTYAHGKGWLTA